MKTNANLLGINGNLHFDGIVRSFPKAVFHQKTKYIFNKISKLTI